MIRVTGLKKAFRGRAGTNEVLRGLDFTVEPGEIYGLLGPNGAGKTTAMRCVATLLKPDEGAITVDGHDTQAKPRVVRESLGFLTGDMKLAGNLSPRRLLRFFGELNHLADDVIEQRSDELAGYLDMRDYLDRPVEKLSTGMKQKAAIAVALIHDPSVIMFDEPTNGLDILAAKTVVDFLNDYRSRGKTILLSTHIMAEAEKLCDRIGILLGGVLAAQGTRDELMEIRSTNSLEDAFFQLAREQGVTTDA